MPLILKDRLGDSSITKALKRDFDGIFRWSYTGFFYAPPRMRKRIRLRRTLCTAHMAIKNLCALFILSRSPIQFIGTPNKAIKLWIKRPTIIFTIITHRIYLHIRRFHNFLPLKSACCKKYNISYLISREAREIFIVFISILIIRNA